MSASAIPVGVRFSGWEPLAAGSLRGNEKMQHTPEQILSILNAVRATPKWPSAVEIPGLSQFDPTHQAEKQRLFDRLHASGLLEMVPGPKGRRTGLGYVVTPKGESERKLLSTHPAIAK